MLNLLKVPAEMFHNSIKKSVLQHMKITICISLNYWIVLYKYMSRSKHFIEKLLDSKYSGKFFQLGKYGEKLI